MKKFGSRDLRLSTEKTKAELQKPETNTKVKSIFFFQQSASRFELDCARRQPTPVVRLKTEKKTQTSE